MIRFSTAADLLESFRTADRQLVEIPDSVVFPLILRDYISWNDPSRRQTAVVFQSLLKNAPVAYGIVFKYGSGQTDAPAQMCQWCHSVRRGPAVDLLTVDVGPKRRIGLYLCRTLDCKEHLSQRVPGTSDLRETIPGDEKIKRLLERMTEFTQRNLF
jgi:hypothetical protein